MRLPIWTLAAIPLGMLFSTPFLFRWFDSHDVCVRTAPGTCWRQHVPLHGGPYPCQVCVERKWFWDPPPDAPQTGDPTPCEGEKR